ncbi:MAG: TonB-dependent receptor [Comamonadaceae bacterium]|nr:TonB-dependent receptor [Comamonadaceae bacterium]
MSPAASHTPLAARPTAPAFPRRAAWLWAALAITPLALPAWAQQQATAPAAAASEAEAVQAFTLGTVEVRARRDDEGSAADAQRLTQRELERANARTVAEAVALLPGVSLTHNNRNEAMLSLRGFDSRQVSVYVDGVPLYVPYDGYVDFGRFTTFDLAEVRVAKSGASLLYGPNTLGGAVNLVTRKPARPFEGDARLGLGAGRERKAAVNLGGRQGRWYYQAGLSYLDAHSFPLPKDFQDFKRRPTDTGRYRANADRSDRRLSLKLGLTPNASDEYAVGYVRQDGEKGNPVYTGRSTQRNAVRYWRWPYWDKDSLYFLGATRIGSNNLLKARLYRDTYRNGLDIYTDASYTRHDPTSSYKDVSQGASLEWTHAGLKNHELVFALHYKRDEHTDAASGRNPEKYYRDLTTSLVAEDRITLGPRWQLTAGLSHDKRDAQRVHHWPTGATSATNGLLKLGYALTPQGDELYAVLSRKTRFPTIKDRYSARLGRALPNPDLKPEAATHLELGASGRPWAGAQGQASLFYSRVRDEIQTQIVPSDACGGATCDQAQNVGRTRSAGLELALAQRLSAQWQLNAAYTYLHRTNLSDRRVLLTGTPRQRLLAGLQWQPLAQWQLRAEVEAETGRRMPVAASGRSQVLTLPGYGLLHLRARYQPRPDMALDFGVTNLGDKWYQWADGIPMPGRSWYANFSYRF